jgi:predicted  nucleic acid-binding Zn-ribbon protein
LLEQYESIYNRLMSRASSLHRLQELDLGLARSRKRIDEIRLVIEDDEAVVQTREVLDGAKETQSVMSSEHSRAEHAVASQRSKIEQTEKTLYSGTVRNPKELQDRQQEAESLKRYLVVLEDRLLDAMIALEDSEQKVQAASGKLAEAEELFNSTHAELTAELEELKSEIARLETEHDAALADVGTDDLQLYNALREKIGGHVLALAQDGSCSICGVDLSSSEFQSIRTSDNLIRCRQCGRILYAG